MHIMNKANRQPRAAMLDTRRKTIAFIAALVGFGVALWGGIIVLMVNLN
jgi:hypothetical protein